MSVLKSLFAISLTGASGVGGTLIYQSCVPLSWQALLVKEGYYFLNTDDEFKAIYHYQKEGNMKTEAPLKDITSEVGHSSIKTWCETEMPKTSDGDTKTKNKLISLCTYDGVVTVKSRLISSGKHSYLTDETSDATKYYKILFGIYRYYEPFLNWLKKKANDQTLSESTTVDTGYIKLKEVCEKELPKNYKEITGKKPYKNLFWWCRKAEYETFEALAKNRYPSWQTDEEGTEKEYWKDTPQVKQYIQNGEQQEALTGTKIGEWCKNNKNTPLENNDSYRDKFLVFLSVCKKELKGAED